MNPQHRPGRCRIVGHDYRVVGITATETRDGYPRHVECGRCRTVWPVPAPTEKEHPN